MIIKSSATMLSHFCRLFCLLSIASAADPNPQWYQFKYTGNYDILEAKEYLDKVTQKFAENLELVPISSMEYFPIDEFDLEININMTTQGIETMGSANLHSGFVNKIKAIKRIGSYEKKFAGLNTVYTDVSFLNINIMYDVDYEFDNQEETGAILIEIPYINFTMTVNEDVKTKELSSTIELRPFNCETLKYTGLPYTKNMQFVVKGLQTIKKSESYGSGLEIPGGVRGSELCHILESSIQKWKLDIFLKVAVEDLGFATVCYYCNKQASL